MSGVREVFYALQHWANLVDADQEDGKQLEVRYEQAATPISLSRIELWKDTLLLFHGVDDDGKGRTVILTTLGFQLEARLRSIDEEGETQKIGFSIED